jgi:hypothetical protein
VKLGALGEGAEWNEAPSPTAPNELNYVLPSLLMSQIQNLLDTFYLNKKGQFRQKTISSYSPFNEDPSNDTTSANVSRWIVPLNKAAKYVLFLAQNRVNLFNIPQ